MDRRFVDELSFRFDQLDELGFTVLTEGEVLRWWARQRVTRSVWQDLMDRWADRSEAPLSIGQKSGRYVLIRDADGWLCNLTQWV